MNEFHSNLKTEKLPGQEKLRVDITLEEKARTKKEERERETDKSRREKKPQEVISLMVQNLKIMSTC